MSVALNSDERAVPAKKRMAVTGPHLLMTCLNDAWKLQESEAALEEAFAAVLTPRETPTMKQAMVLVYLHQIPGASQRDLVNSGIVDRATASELLRRLGPKGKKWVMQKQDPEDHRAVVIDLTVKGREIAGKIVKIGGKIEPKEAE